MEGTQERNYGVNKYIDTIVYAGRIKDDEVLLKSSSGGAFTVLSNHFLNKGNAVIASVYNYTNHSAEYRLILSSQDRNLALGSKYMQSKLGSIFKVANDWLRDNPGKLLLFVGMGCQADGFRRYAESVGIRERTCIVDIVCHGSPSPKLWREYAELLEHRYSGKISYLTFKDKRYGWKLPSAFAYIDEKEIAIDDYVKVFYSQCALRPSCHECPYATTERKTDLTIGDFWHIEKTIPKFYNPNGNSLFLIHTDRGERVFDSIKNNLDYCLSDTEQCWQKNLEAPTPVSEQRHEFWLDYQKEGIEFIMRKYGRLPFKTRVKKKIIKIVRGGVLTSNSISCYADYSERRAA